MIVRCARCQTAYRLGRASVPERGMRVRCPGCGHVFRVRPATAAGDGEPRPRRLVETRPSHSVDDLSLERDERRPPQLRQRPTTRRTPQTQTRTPTPSPQPMRRALGGQRTLDLSAPETQAGPEMRLETAPFQPGRASPVATPRPEPTPRRSDSPRSRDDLQLAPATPAPFERPADGTGPEQPVSPPATPSPFATPSPLATPSPFGSERPSGAPTAVATRRPKSAAASDLEQARERALRLARVLVSDILVYNQEDRDRALREGTLASTLGAEVNRAWELYKSKVDPEVLRKTSYFKDALNEILAAGQKVF
ncbi:MAG: zinc-ribbon domain-containing protein [Candidatus Latescibacterota bacterium]|nr:MAG: zinc-ribbon domain-containing protein [Candidatus Latescibacterota bacterium]